MDARWKKFRFTEPVVHYLNDADNNTWVIRPSSVHKLQPGASPVSIHQPWQDPAGAYIPAARKPVVLLAQAGFTNGYIPKPVSAGEETVFHPILAERRHLL